MGIRHRYIRQRRPQQNGKVERSHRIDHEEFWSRQRFADLEAATTTVRQWEMRYNYERPSLALKGRPGRETGGRAAPKRLVMPLTWNAVLPSSLAGVNLDETQHRSMSPIDPSSEQA
jgi:transposase InsO family protein